MTQGQGAPERVDVDEALRYIAERLAEAKQLDGYRGALHLVDRTTGKGATITFWESEQALDAAEEAMNRMRDQAAQVISPTAPLTTHHYEVALSELPG